MKILLPIDGSDGALAAVHHVMRLREAGLQLSCVLANVQAPASLYEVVVAHDAQVIEDVSAAAAAHSLAPAQALLRGSSIAFDTETATGDPGHLLIEIGERCGCDMVVMGARGTDARARGEQTGSVADALVHESPWPVTLVRAPELPNS